MAAPSPPSLEDIEEDLASAAHTDPAFSPLGDGGEIGGERDEVASVAEKAVQFVLAYDQLREDAERFIPAIFSAVERHIADLRTIASAPSSKQQ